MTEDEGQESNWDRNRVQDEYRRHTRSAASKISLPSVDFSFPNIPMEFDSVFDRKAAAVLVLTLLVAGGIYFDVADMLITTPEERAVNIADKNAMIEEYRQEEGELTSTVVKASGEVLTNLEGKGAVSSNSEEIYVVDYTGPDSNGITAYVNLEQEEVIETDYNLRIG